MTPTNGTRRGHSVDRILYINFVLAMFVIIVACASVLVPVQSVPAVPLQEAYATVTVGDTEIQGYQPSDMISTDTNIENIDATEGVKALDKGIVKLVLLGLPYLMLACVVMIIYRAVTNMFKPREERYPMGEVMKSIFSGFFWILFAWIAVEIIVLAITSGEGLIVSTLFG